MPVMKQPLSGLFIDKEADTEKQVEVPSTVEGEAATIVTETVPGEWFWTLIARNGNIIAGGRGFNTSQSALKSIRAVRTFFRNKVSKVYNRVTGK